MSSQRVASAVAAHAAAAAALAELDYDHFTHSELLDLLNELETITWKMPTIATASWPGCNARPPRWRWVRNP